MTGPVLVVGFDSAWTAGKRGAVVGAVRQACGAWRELGPPEAASFPEAGDRIREWKAREAPATTVVMLDHPTIVPNRDGQRPVENLVASPVSRARGGVQPANRGRARLFGEGAPVWAFLEEFGGAADPRSPPAGDRVVETFPVLALLALGWTLADDRRGERLPKYDPARRGTFSREDWRHVCAHLRRDLWGSGLLETAAWLEEVAARPRPSKADQDGVDAALCLRVGIHWVEGGRCLMIGDPATGLMLVPWSPDLVRALEARCEATGREPGAWLHPVTLG